MQNYYYECWYETYMSPGWAYNQQEKEQRINTQRSLTATKIKACREKLYECSNKITQEYIKLFENCLKKHDTFVSHYDYALLAYLNDDFEKSLELSFQLLECEQYNEGEQLESVTLHQLGTVCIQTMAYEKAIAFLTETIRLNPNNRNAHFDRALAYFETGAFESAIQDYIASQRNEEKIQTEIASEDFKTSLLKNLRLGATDSVCEFVPTLCNSVYGLGETLWITAQHPIDSTTYFVNACYDMSESLVDYCRNVDWNTVEGYVDHVKYLYQHFDQLNDSEKGELIGYTIGKYGTDILAGGAICRGVAAFQNLKKANRICNLEAITLSNTNKEAIQSVALKHATDRERFFSEMKIQWDKQNKHIPGTNNYQTGKSILSHPNPEELLKNMVEKDRL